MSVIADDSIELKQVFFAVGNKGVLSGDSFINGAGVAMQIALLGISEHPALTATDFFIV